MKTENILNLLPRNIVNDINLNKINELQEIRIRVNRNTIFKYDNDEFISNFIPDEKTIISILQMFCENSIYSYQSQICNGFITIFGGHRVGITGNIAMRDGRISNINYVSSLNIRVAKEIIGAANSVIKYIFDYEDLNKENFRGKHGEQEEDKLKLCNTLIISPPRMWENNSFT